MMPLELISLQQSVLCAGENFQTRIKDFHFTFILIIMLKKQNSFNLIIKLSTESKEE